MPLVLGGTDPSQSAASGGVLMTSMPIDYSKRDTSTIASSLAEGEDMEEEGKDEVSEPPDSEGNEEHGEADSNREYTKRRYGMAMKSRMKLAMKMFTGKGPKQRLSSRPLMKDKAVMRSESQATTRKRERTRTPKRNVEKKRVWRERMSKAKKRK